ncbi:acyl carrier protein [Murimonas intestini]|uniref:acyl carrier protein n=1 Tax=Murimonas intestini TaxID=1337051 RepID=UPI0011DD963B|nr:acyl carrier protein [Murimonas intestini]
MNREEVLANVIEFASMAFKKDAADIREDTKISEELGVLSMQRIAMASSIENEYDIMIPVAKFGQFDTIGDLVNFILEEA